MTLWSSLLMFVAAACVLRGPVGPVSVAIAAEPEPAGRIRDVLWVWGNPEMVKPGPHTVATFAGASPAERARLLDVPNVVMAGLGLPNDDQKAEELTRQVAAARRIAWEITPEGEHSDRPFDYRSSAARVRKLADKYPQIQGVLLDDMSTVKIDRGFKPEHIRQLRELLGEANARIKVWGVLYTMSFDRKGMSDYIKELDVINLWTWHAKDVVHLEKNVARCERQYPGKPIIVGLYLYDYGENRRFPPELLEKQCAVALELACAGRIQGIVFLTINDDPEAVKWTADWIKRVGDRKIGPAQSRPDRAASFSGDRLPCRDPWPTWIESLDGRILMSYIDSGSIRVAVSGDEGRSWEPISTLQEPGMDLSGGYFTRLPNKGLLLVVTTGPERKRVWWVRSEDDGRTWSARNEILAPSPNRGGYGPICVMQDGRWAYCLYDEGGDKGCRALVIWSSDQGKTWGKPVAFPTPSDGNCGLTECTVAQLGPGNYVAAIRADEGKSSSDGFYLSRSQDGVSWSVPESLDERGRMPLFYRIGDCWVLAYRQYDFQKKIQHSVMRVSTDGRDWSKPRIIESGVNAGPQLVRVADKLIAFNTLYPDRSVITRHVVRMNDGMPVSLGPIGREK